MDTIKVKILIHGIFREKLRLDSSNSLIIEINKDSCLLDILKILKFENEKNILVFKNGKNINKDLWLNEKLNNEDVIMIFPPIAGGI